MYRATLLSLLLTACASRDEAEAWRDWYDPGSPAEVTEALTFTDAPYAIPADTEDGIATLRTDLLTQDFDNDGPIFAPDSLPDDVEACSFWEALDSDAPEQLPRTITGYVTSHPRVYRKIEGCAPDGSQSDEKYYGSYWLEDGTGGIFVLRDSKVAPFDIGARVTLEVRAVRRRFGIDMIYVHDTVEVEPGPFPLHYETVARPLTQADQSTVKRVTGTVVTEPSTFGEVLLSIDGYDRPAGTPPCGPEDAATRAPCLVAQLDQEIARRGVTLTPGERVTLTGPVAASAFFDVTGVFNFYGLYLTRIGQITRLDASPAE